MRRRAPPDDIDDLVQETFLRVHRGLGDLRAAERVAPWVSRLARSVLVDHYRRHRPTEALDVDVAAPEGPPALDATPMVASWLPGFVAGLPETYREAVRLSELEGLSQREVARRLGLSPSGARTRVQRGRAKLREALLACCAVRLEGGEVVDVRSNCDC
jgi:RNA polymerase sigma-70 factor (ECF subfamily)